MNDLFKPDNESPLLIFGGPYSNLQATETLRDVAAKLGIPASNILCTGDLVAYCAQPEETINLIRDWGIAVIAGNCEESIGNGADDCGCGFEEGTACDLLSAQWYNYTLPRVSDGNKSWMRDLPPQMRFSYQGRSFIAIHGGLERNNQFLFASSSTEEKQQQLLRASSDIILAGHCGIPFGQQLSKGYWLNAGVIGMPANNGSPDGWYMVISPLDDSIQASWHRLEYNYLQAQAVMSESGLANGYMDALASGLWPSLDVLPENEKMITGQAIDLPPITIR